MGYACIYIDNKGGTHLHGFHVFEVNVKGSSRVIGAPIETGEVAIDNKVIDPMTVQVIGTIVNGDDSDLAFDELDAMFANRDYQFYSVCDGDRTYRNLILTTLPFKRTSEKVDFYNFELLFTEAMIIQGSTSMSENSENSDTRHGGPASPTQS